MIRFKVARYHEYTEEQGNFCSWCVTAVCDDAQPFTFHAWGDRHFHTQAACEKYLHDTLEAADALQYLSTD